MNRVFALLIALVLFIVPLIAEASSGLARLSLTRGEVLLYDEENSDWVPAASNTPVEEGDRIWCADGARAEIELKTGSVIRLGSKTTIDFVRLDDDEQQVYLGSGRLYARTIEGDRDLQIDSEDATASIGRKSRVHIDLVGGRDSDTEVSVVKGTVYVESPSGKTRVRTGEDLIFSDDGAEVAPLNLPDEWEQWNEARDRKIFRKKADSRYLPEELATYEEELAANGEWVTIEEYGYVWRPTVAIGINWAPYQQGRWFWRGGSYIWIATEPWGWAPHHYGRWQHHPRWGWCWVPPRRGDVYWSPGYVAWADTGRDLAWVPLAPNEVYYGSGFYGSLSINISHVDRHTSVRPINTYQNVRVRNAVMVVDRNAFARGTGKPRQGRPAEFSRQKVVTPPPQFRPSGREARMPIVKHVTPESKPPPSLQRRSPTPLKERFPRLEPERRARGSEQRQLPTRDQQKSPAAGQQNAPQPVPHSKTPSAAQPPRAMSPSQAQQPLEMAPVIRHHPSEAPDRVKPGHEKGPRESAQPGQQTPSAQAGHTARSPETTTAPEPRNEGRKSGRERQSQTESKPVEPAQKAGTKPMQPQRVWKIAPREATKAKPKDIPGEAAREEQGKGEQKAPRK